MISGSDNEILSSPAKVNTSDFSRCRKIILYVLRILATIGIITYAVILWRFTDHYGMAWFFGGLATIAIIVELNAELLIRDLPNRGIRNISPRTRWALASLVYGIVFASSPILFHSFFKLFAAGGHNLGKGIFSLQIGLWKALFAPDHYVGITGIAITIFSILLLATTGALCYLILSASWRRRWAAAILLVMLEAVAAFFAGNSPG